MSPTEPSADLRQMANWIRQMFVALTNEGFSQDEALKIIAHLLANLRGQT